ncbi:hypothetical protein T484DRAFT_2653998 [Baffinella frigidus]|nr:hypothetical protein T484DRAFT_2653998 [Cryptophyta sp. CCMP2293]
MSQCWDRISTVDVKFHETVREVLQKSKIPQYEGTLQINWNTVLKDYIKGFDDIVADGGWKVIFGKDDDEDEDEEDEEDDESFKGGGSGSGSDEDSSGEGSDDEDSDLSEYSEDESESEELSDEGMDSDEAEQWAQDEDTKKREEERLKGDRPSSKPGMGSKAGAAKKRCVPSLSRARSLSRYVTLLHWGVSKQGLSEWRFIVRGFLNPKPEPLNPNP